MDLKIWFLLLMVAIFYLVGQLLGCQSITNMNHPSSSVKPAPGLLWSNKEWDESAVDTVGPNLDKFEKASDWDKFCPNFKALNDENKVYAISYLASLIAKKESDFNPKSRYQEPMPPNGPGTVSAGLFQISVSDTRYGGPCLALNKDSIYDPKINIFCAIHMMAKLVDRDGIIAGEKTGLARYWSVMRSTKNGSPRPSFVFIKDGMNTLDVCMKK